MTGEQPGGLVGPGLADMVVVVHRVGPGGAPASGEPVARARTDAQGQFHLSAILPPGRYDVAVHATPEGPALTSQRIDLEGVRPRRLEDLHLVVPAIGAPRSPGIGQ